uniref:Uncharacterized protein n=1 Tax=Ditylenchus dipsaci TaxID=166011 RepID=A0A915DRN3_9BILA
MSLQIYCSSLILVAFVSFLASASPVPNSQFENSNSNGFCAEYPRLSLCQLRTVLDNAILEIDFLVNGMGTGLLNSEYTTSPIAETRAQRKKRENAIFPSSSTPSTGPETTIPPYLLARAK